MLFNSLAFFVFFPIVVALHYALPHRYRWALLLAASYVFYGFWSPRYLFFLLLSTTVDYFVGLGLGRARRPRVRKALVVASLVQSFGTLFVFKYLHFFAGAASRALSTRWPSFDFVLPIGISFYTFQTVSYILDVYRKEREPERHFGYFALFVAFFPHLVAGPIVRAKKLLPGLKAERRWDFERTVSGLEWMLWGFFKKVVIADRAALFVGAVYDHPERYQGATVVLATYAFAFQIYGDFSGYSDIAIGAARVLGVELSRNFDQPYASASVVEFWRRWHMSLSTWFRDYVYHPLGGARVAWPRRAFNIAVVFLLSGLWHGANWTFVVWGAYHGVLMIVTLAVIGVWRRTMGKIPVRESLRSAARAMGVVVTFHLVCVGWVFFRAKDLSRALAIFGRLGATDDVSPVFELEHVGPAPPDALRAELAILLAAVIVLELVSPRFRERESAPLSRPLRYVAWASLASAVLLTAVQTHTPFIYFQF